MAHMVKCVKLGREAEGLDEPPFDNELGQKIYDNVSKLAWEQWQEHMKMLLNEYRLQPWKKDHQEFIVQQMKRVLLRRRLGEAEGVRRAEPVISGQ